MKNITPPFIQPAPSDTRTLTCGVDVFNDHLHVQVIAWPHRHGSWAMIVDIKLDGDTALDAIWDDLDRMLAQSFPTNDGRELKVRSGCIDVGGPNTETVHRFCRRRSHFFATKGSPGEHPIWPKCSSFIGDCRVYIIGVYEAGIRLARLGFPTDHFDTSVLALAALKALDALAENSPEQSLAEDDGWSWAIVEVMGHRKHVGRIREVEQYGTKMLRVDVPLKGDPEQCGWRTHFYSGGSLFALTPTDEASALRYNKPYQPPAIARYHDPEDDEPNDESGYAGTGEES